MLKGKAGVSDTDVANFPKIDPEDQEDFIELVVNPEKKKEKAKEPGTFVDGKYTDVESNVVSEDTVYVSLPLDKSLFNTIKEIANLTGESPDELISRHVVDNLHHDIECLGAGVYKCFGDKDKLSTLKKRVKKVTGLEVDEFLMRSMNDGLEISDESRQWLYSGGFLKDHIVPKRSKNTEC